MVDPTDCECTGLNGLLGRSCTRVFRCRLGIELEIRLDVKNSKSHTLKDPVYPQSSNSKTRMKNSFNQKLPLFGVIFIVKMLFNFQLWSSVPQF